MKSKTVFTFIAILSVASSISCSNAEDKNHECDTSKLPIERESNCNSFFREDDRLNNTYKKLLSSLNKDQKNTLRSSQREWIKRRDKICQKIEEEAFESCSLHNPSCENESLDMCVIQLTSDRATELGRLNTERASGKLIDLKKLSFRYEQ